MSRIKKSQGKENSTWAFILATCSTTEGLARSPLRFLRKFVPARVRAFLSRRGSRRADVPASSRGPGAAGPGISPGPGIGAGISPGPGIGPGPGRSRGGAAGGRAPVAAPGAPGGADGAPRWQREPPEPLPASCLQLAGDFSPLV